MTLPLLVSSYFKVFTSLQGQLVTVLAFGTLKTQHNLLGCLRLLSENWLRLTSKTALLSVITPSTLGHLRILTLLVLGHFVEGVFGAFTFAKGLSCFRYVHHFILPLFGSLE